MRSGGSGGIEELGRRERYALFERVSLKIGADVVAVGHHADDNTETILHRILRGTGLRGLSGIQRSRALDQLRGAAQLGGGHHRSMRRDAARSSAK